MSRGRALEKLPPLCLTLGKKTLAASLFPPLAGGSHAGFLTSRPMSRGRR